MRLLLSGVLILAAEFAFAEPPKPVDDSPKKVAAVIDNLQTLTKACELFKVLVREYPKTLDQLMKPPRGRPFLDDDSILKDPWGKKYEYDPKGKRNDGKKPDIWTVTPNKDEIGNWPEKK